MKVIPERFGEVLNLLLISRALVVPRVSPLFSLWGAGRRKRDLGNEVVVKRDGCTQAIVEPLCEKNHVAERNGGLIIVKLLDCGKSYFS